MAIGILLILILIFTFIVYLEVRKYFIDKKLQGLRGIKGIPILGAAGRLMGSSNYNFIDLISKFFDEAKSTSFRAWAGPFLGKINRDNKIGSLRNILMNNHFIPFRFDLFNLIFSDLYMQPSIN